MSILERAFTYVAFDFSVSMIPFVASAPVSDDAMRVFSGNVVG